MAELGVQDIQKQLAAQYRKRMGSIPMGSCGSPVRVGVVTMSLCA